MLKLTYTITLTIVFQILPSRPMTYEVVDKGTEFNYITLRYYKK